MNTPVRLFILFLILMMPLSLMAQKKPKKYHAKGPKHVKFRFPNRIKIQEALSIYGSLGVTNYYGDLCDNWDCMHPRPNIGAGVLYRFSKYFSSKSEINYLRMASGDVYPGRNLSFRSGNVELFTALAFDYFKWTKNFKFRNKISPYAFGGVGILFYNPRAELNGQWYTLRKLETEGRHYGIATPVIPIGIGAKIKYTRNIDFLAEASYRFTFTDHLDDASSFRFKPIASFSNPTAAALSNRTAQGDAFLGYRGDPNKNDGYFVFSIKVRYTFTYDHTFKNKYPELHRKIY